MKSTALCISGQPRNVESGFSYIKRNILDLNDCDVFIHSWIDEEHYNKSYINSGGNVASSNVPENVDEMIMDLYHPTYHIFEKQRHFNEKNYATRKFPGINVFNSLSQLYSIYAANRLKSLVEVAEQKEYDTVIRIRFDWAINAPVELKSYNTKEYLYLPNDCPPTHRGGFNDQFSISNSLNGDIYANLYNGLTTIWNYYPHVPFVNECLLGKHLELNGVNVEPIPIPYTILRS